jgi:hypothetical protein
MQVVPDLGDFLGKVSVVDSSTGGVDQLQLQNRQAIQVVPQPGVQQPAHRVTARYSAAYSAPFPRQLSCSARATIP